MSSQAKKTIHFLRLAVLKFSERLDKHEIGLKRITPPPATTAIYSCSFPVEERFES